MPVSLRKKLANVRDEVLQDTDIYGRFYAMDKHGVKDYKAFSKYLFEETGSPTFGLTPKVSLSSGRDLGGQVVDAFANHISRTQAEWTIERKRMQDRIEYLEFQLRQRERKNIEKVGDLIRQCSD